MPQPNVDPTVEPAPTPSSQGTFPLALLRFTSPPHTENTAGACVTLLGVGCSSDSFFPASFGERWGPEFSDADGVCYNFLLEGFGGDFPLEDEWVFGPDPSGAGQIAYTGAEIPRAIIREAPHQANCIPAVYGMVYYFPHASQFPAGTHQAAFADQGYDTCRPGGGAVAMSFPYPP